MKHKYVFIIISLSVAIFFASCEPNKQPTAIAGPDQLITLPTDSIVLDGSASGDPDGTISEWIWKKISGPATFTIINPAVAKTTAKNLATGIYQFELTVKDDEGLFAKDIIEITVNSAAQANRSPFANAGPDQTITLPISNITLNGSGSIDPDNNIISYLWKKISGPSSLSIANTNSVQTQVINLAQGNYEFELSVTDSDGLFSKDTMQVTVKEQILPTISCAPTIRPVINLQLIPLANIPDAGKSVVWADNKLFFAGGNSNSGVLPTSRVDIFDLTTQTWSTANLSLGRINISAVACANKVFFAGGTSPSGPSSRVDIYDIATQTWSTAELSEPRIRIVTATTGNKVFFAGGCTDMPFEWAGVSNKIDMYDLSTNTWSVKILSETKIGFTASTAGSKIYFAGGWYTNSPATSSTSANIDIYDDLTGTWSTSALSVAKAFQAGIFKNGKIFWGGGGIYIDEPWIGSNVFTCKVEVFDVNNHATTFANLSAPFAWFDWNGTFEKGDKIGFINYDDPSSSYYVDIYNTTTNSWSIGSLSQAPFNYKCISANNNVYLIGDNQLWRLEL